MSQLTITLDDAINQAHGRAMSAADSMRRGLIDLANEVLRCGSLLIERKEKTRRGAWCDMFSTVKGKSRENSTFHFDYSLGCRYMKLARLHPEKFTTVEEAREFLREVHIIAGVVEDKQGHGPQQGHEFSFIGEVIGTLSKFDALWNKHKGNEFVAKLEGFEREQLADTLKPLKLRIEEIWGKLHA